MSDETQVSPEQTTEIDSSVEAPAEETKVHPAYDKLLAELPEAWHSKVTPYLQEQDKYFQQQLEKYTPFKDLVDEGVSADFIRGGLNLANAIESNPTEVYSSLQTYLKDQGLLAEEAKQVAQDMMEEESGEDFEDMFDGEKIPKALQKEIDALKAQQAESQDYIYQQELAKETDRYTVELESEMAQLKATHSINEAHEVAIYDIMNSALNAGREITVAEAARQLSQMIPGGFAPAGQAEAAPTIVGNAGGAGVVAPDLSVPKDDKGKRAMLAQMFDQYNKSR
jgi:hypothetical protein